LGWFAFRDGIIAFGAPGLVFIYMGISSFEQTAERVARQMQEQADVAGIRAWAAEYKPDPNASRWDTLDGNEGFDVPQERWPEAIRRLQPNYVSFTTDSKCVHLVFGGGFGHWGLVVGPKGSAPCSGNTLLLEDRAWVRTLGDGTWFWVQR
jgi:type II secretory pathway pseudopilin PulG